MPNFRITPINFDHTLAAERDSLEAAIDYAKLLGFEARIDPLPRIENAELWTFHPINGVRHRRPSRFAWQKGDAEVHK